MFDGREYYRQSNAEVESELKQGLSELRSISDAAEPDSRGMSGFFAEASGMLLDYAGLESKLDEEYFTESDIEQLHQHNSRLFEQVLPDGYASSFSNPAFASEKVGIPSGRLLSAIVAMLRRGIVSIYLHDMSILNELVDMVLRVFEATDHGQTPDSDAIEAVFKEKSRILWTSTMERRTLQQLDPRFGIFDYPVRLSSADDLRYLYRYGLRISDYEIQTARLLWGYPQSEIERLAEVITDSYRMSFELEGKDLSTKSTVMIHANIGYEPLLKRVLHILGDFGLTGMMSAMRTTRYHQQYRFDHKFDLVMVLDDTEADHYISCYDSIAQSHRDLARACSGVMAISSFGQPGFAPEVKEQAYRPDEQKMALQRKMMSAIMEIGNRYMPREEFSFTTIAFPSPEIRGDYRQIFSDTVNINTLEREKHERIQQRMIEALDKAEHVHIKGSEGNRTDLRIALRRLEDPASQTNFINSTSSSNIPLGEVYTSPRLTGSSGTLHVPLAYLGGLRYENLQIEFEDGYVTDYSCDNYDTEDQNKQYIRENILFPHDSLPIGEFAIGSNTVAYSMARRHRIMDLLPVLILEKMGPHIALGDTCFAREEDHPVFNRLDGKEVVARDNAKSMLRRENPAEAYTNKHIDITLPYDCLDSIKAVSNRESIPIIEGGRFVLEGTTELNVHIEEAVD